jgi:hypothetical protein
LRLSESATDGWKQQPTTRGLCPSLFDPGDAALAANVGVVDDHRTAAHERFSSVELLPPHGGEIRRPLLA